MALSEFPKDETFDIFFDKLGEENDTVRKNAKAGICRYANLLIDRIIDTQNSPDWVVRNSGLGCILNLAETDFADLEKFVTPVINACEDSNSIVRTNALTTLAKLFAKLKKQNAGKN